MPQPPCRLGGLPPCARGPRAGGWGYEPTRTAPAGRWIAGVCLAVANRFGWSVALVRILAIVAVVFFGLSLWAYILLWIVVPPER